MLRRICSNPACGRVIDGEPPVSKEEPDAVCVVGDEVVFEYEDLCAECAEKLRALVRGFEEKPKPAPRQKAVAANAPQVGEAADAVFVGETNVQADAEPVTVEVPKPEPAPEPKPKKGEPPRQLANQVVKRFPIPSRKG